MLLFDFRKQTDKTRQYTDNPDCHYSKPETALGVSAAHLW